MAVIYLNCVFQFRRNLNASEANRLHQILLKLPCDYFESEMFHLLENIFNIDQYSLAKVKCKNKICVQFN